MSSGQLTILERLQADWRRFTELDEALNDPAIATDPGRITAIARERGALARVAVPYGRYLEIDRKIAEAETLDALAEIWTKIPRAQQVLLTADKDKRKKELTQTGEAE